MTSLSQHPRQPIKVTVDERLTQVVEVTHRSPVPWLRLSMAAAAVAAIGNVVSLSNVDRYYGAEAEVFVDQAIAQDLVNLVVVAPLTIALT
ncbi:MAG: hypothetical protein ACJ72Y_06585, partial [Actinomycetes bacterium]